MQKLDLAYEAPTPMSNYFEPSSDGIIGPDPRITIVAEWDAMVEPVQGLRDFDFTQEIPPIRVNHQEGKLVIIDGRKRFLACKAARRRIAYIVETFSRRRGKDEFLRHHRPLK